MLAEVLSAARGAAYGKGGPWLTREARRFLAEDGGAARVVWAYVKEHPSVMRTDGGELCGWLAGEDGPTPTDVYGRLLWIDAHGYPPSRAAIRAALLHGDLCELLPLVRFDGEGDAVWSCEEDDHNDAEAEESSNPRGLMVESGRYYAQRDADGVFTLYRQEWTELYTYDEDGGLDGGCMVQQDGVWVDACGAPDCEEYTADPSDLSKRDLAHFRNWLADSVDRIELPDVL